MARTDWSKIDEQLGRIADERAAAKQITTLILQTREWFGERATLTLGVEPVLFSIEADSDGRWGFHVVVRRLRSRRPGFENTKHPGAWG